MLLKKTLEYKKYSISFIRVRMNERIDSGKMFLGCQGCGFLNDGACILRYENGININDLKCGFGYRNYPNGDVLYKYVAKEEISS